MMVSEHALRSRGAVEDRLELGGVLQLGYLGVRSDQRPRPLLRLRPFSREQTHERRE